MRKLTCSVAAVLVVFAVAQPAAAAADPGTPTTSSPSGSGRGALADRDGNKISDAFQPALDAADPGDRFHVIVTYSGPGNATSAKREVGSFEVTHEYTIVRGFAGVMTASQIRGLSRNPNVRRIEQNIRVQLHLDASRRDFGVERARTDYPAVTGAGTPICILDTGLHAAHEQFDTKAITFRDWVGTSTTPYDDHGHGTHVADIAAGDGTGGVNAPTFRGVAPGSPLYIGKVLDSTGYGDDAEIVQAVEWCAAQPDVRVISMSLGTPEASDGNDALSDAVNNAVTSAGKVVVVAAGNSGDMPRTVGSPGAAVNAITVGAVAEWSAPVNAGAGRHSDGVYLAPFSSRGPTLANVLKPDVVAPGVSVTAAKSNSVATYITYDGTSMATPFVAGTAALALAANPALSPSAIRSLIEGTAQDRGPAGKDNDWGAGLLDGYAVVASASGAGSYTPTAFPSHSRVSGSAPNNGQWSYQFTIGPDALAVPIAATITLDGEAICVFPWPHGCLGWEWDPDLEARLYAPNGTILSESTCAADDECGIGRQETVHAMPTTAGTYTVQVYACNTSCGGNGEGGSFAVDLSHGPVGTPPPPTNQPPVANAGPDQTVSDADGNGAQAVTLNGSSSTDADGAIVSYEWNEGGSQIATGATPTVGFSVGTHTLALTVTDNDGASSTDQAVVTVRANTPPVANAGPDQAISDSDGNGTQTATLNGTTSTDSDGTIASHVWTEGGSQIATGPTPAVTFAVGTHTVTLTVTDNGGATATDQVIVTVTAASPPPSSMHVGDIDGTRTAKKGGSWTATVTITVHTSTHVPLWGVVVTGSWSDGTTVSCTTNASGSCSPPVKNLGKKAASITFTVNGLSRSGYVYASPDNHDPDGDSTGTSITLTRP